MPAITGTIYMDFAPANENEPYIKAHWIDWGIPPDVEIRARTKAESWGV